MNNRNDVTGIIKRHRVRPAGKRMLGVPVAAEGAAPDPQARIIQHRGRAVAVEIACVCGKRMYLELDCGDVGGDPPSQATDEN